MLEKSFIFKADLASIEPPSGILQSELRRIVQVGGLEQIRGGNYEIVIKGEESDVALCRLL